MKKIALIAASIAVLASPAFAEDAKTKSDDTGSAAEGGELPYYTKTDLDQAFANAIFAIVFWQLDI